jgi:general secretion pathway protein A
MSENLSEFLLSKSYFTASYWQALDGIVDGLSHDKNFVILTGDNGSGKTLLVRKILENLPKFTRSIVVPESELNFRDFISFIHEALVGGTLGKSDSVKVREIRNQLLLHADKKQLDFLIVDTSSPPRKTILEMLPKMICLDHRKNGFQAGFKVLLTGNRDLVKILTDPDLMNSSSKIDDIFELRPLLFSEAVLFLEDGLEKQFVQDCIGKVVLEKIYHLTNGNPSLLAKIRYYIHHAFIIKKNPHLVSEQWVKHVLSSEEFASYIPGQTVVMPELIQKKESEVNSSFLALKKLSATKNSQESDFQENSDNEECYNYHEDVEQLDVGKKEIGADDEYKIPSEDDQETASMVREVIPDDNSDDTIVPDILAKGRWEKAESFSFVRRIFAVLRRRLLTITSKKRSRNKQKEEQSSLPVESVWQKLGNGMLVIEPGLILGEKEKIAEQIAWRRKGTSYLVKGLRYDFRRLRWIISAACVFGLLYNATDLLTTFKVSLGKKAPLVSYLDDVVQREDIEFFDKLGVFKQDTYTFLVEKRMLPRKFLSAEQKKREIKEKKLNISQSLEKAQKLQKSRKILNADGKTYYDLYLDVLKIDPNNREAMQAIIELRDNYFTRVNDARQKEEFQKAEKLFDIVIAIENLTPLGSKMIEVEENKS